MKKLQLFGPKKAKNQNQKFPHTQKKDMQKILPQIKIGPFGSFSQEEIVFPEKNRHLLSYGISYAFRDTTRRVRGHISALFGVKRKMSPSWKLESWLPQDRFMNLYIFIRIALLVER